MITVDVMRWPGGNYTIFDVDLATNTAHVTDVPSISRPTSGDRTSCLRTLDKQQLREYIVSHTEFIQHAKELLAVLESNDNTPRLTGATE